MDENERREKKLQRDREYRVQNRAKILQQKRDYQRKYRAANAEKEREASRKYREANREKLRQASHNYRAANAEKVREKLREYYEDNAEKLRDYQRKYRTDNPEKIRKCKREYHAAKPLPHALRCRLRKAIRNGQKSGSAVRDLGCSIPELRAHLESQFQPGMTWDNWSARGWHIDHIVPLSSFDMSDPEQFLRAVHFTNLQPLWAWQNLSKGARVCAQARARA